ncbi:MAG: hypothetical protein ABW207_14580 [Stenotrophomonas chelatiphaga]|nr:hypothetical protein [Stenotrophomonas chelatiphaga]
MPETGLAALAALATVETFFAGAGVATGFFTAGLLAGLLAALAGLAAALAGLLATLAGAFFAATLVTAVFLATTFFAGALVAAAFLATTFFTGAFFAGAFAAGAFFAVAVLAAVFPVALATGLAGLLATDLAAVFFATGLADFLAALTAFFADFLAATKRSSLDSPGPGKAGLYSLPGRLQQPRDRTHTRPLQHGAVACPEPA